MNVSDFKSTFNPIDLTTYLKTANGSNVLTLTTNGTSIELAGVQVGTTINIGGSVFKITQATASDPFVLTPKSVTVSIDQLPGNPNWSAVPAIYKTADTLKFASDIAVTITGAFDGTNSTYSTSTIGGQSILLDDNDNTVLIPSTVSAKFASSDNVTVTGNFTDVNGGSIDPTTYNQITLGGNLITLDDSNNDVKLTLSQANTISGKAKFATDDVITLDSSGMNSPISVASLNLGGSTSLTTSGTGSYLIDLIGSQKEVINVTSTFAGFLADPVTSEKFVLNPISNSVNINQFDSFKDKIDIGALITGSLGKLYTKFNSTDIQTTELTTNSIALVDNNSNLSISNIATLFGSSNTVFKNTDGTYFVAVKAPNDSNISNVYLYKVVITDGNVTPTQIATLDGVVSLDNLTVSNFTSGNTNPSSVERIKAVYINESTLASANYDYSAESKTVVLKDTASNLLNASTGIFDANNTLKIKGVNVINVSDNNLTLSYAQAVALQNAHITFEQTSTVTVNDTDANLSTFLNAYTNNLGAMIFY